MTETGTDAFPDIDTSLGLPAEVSSFVGRRAERHALRQLLEGNRLVTLTGFGGIGKTRLALKVGNELRRAFHDGVIFVPLAEQTDPHYVAATIAGELGLQGRSGRTTTTALVTYLRSRQMLLVLDNCEHLVDAVAVLTDTLLRACPELRILTTSREPLRIEGEAVHAVAPLSVPRRGVVDRLTQYESVSLFIDRSRTIVPDFELTDENRGAIAAIVSRLEGIPLAIELAAGRLRAMSPSELERNLTGHWELLTRGSRSAPMRQQTMAACIEWSFALCCPVEQRLWSRLAVFGNGFEMDSAREICGPLAEPIDDVLLGLVDKSVVVRIPSDGATRFRLLAPIRHRGAAHLRDTGELAEVRQRHLEWYASLAERVHREWMSERQCDGMDRLRREMGNFRAALDFCTSSATNARIGLRMSWHMLEFGQAEGLFTESLMWSDKVLARDREPSDVRARALRTAAWFAAMQGDIARARSYLLEGLKLAEAYGNDHTRVLLMQTDAFVAMFAAEHEYAATRFDEALKGFEAIGDDSQAAHTLAVSALNHIFRHDVASAIRACERCTALTEPVGECWYRSYAMWIAGLALWSVGQCDEGADLQRASLRLKRCTGDRLGIGVSLEALAWTTGTEEPLRSACLLGAAEAIWEQIDTSTRALPGLFAFHSACVEHLTLRLGAEMYKVTFDKGRKLDPLTAIDLALGEKAEPVPEPRSARRAHPASGPTTLTQRESEIAELVAAGMSNQEIATRLVISKRTAETHVEHILSKLGFTSRSQIVAMVHEKANATEDGQAPLR